MGFMFFFITWLNIYKEKKKNRILHFLYWEFSFMLFVYFRNLFFVSDYVWNSRYYLRINNCIDVMIVPFTVAFLITILAPQKLSNKAVICMHIPSVVLALAYFLTLNDKVLIAIAVYTGIFTLISIFIIYSAASKYDNYVKNAFSNVDKLTVSWIRKGVFFLFGFLAIWGCANYVNTWGATIIYNLFAIILWFLLYQQTINHQPIEIPDIFSFRQKRKGKDIPEQFSFIKKLNQYIEEEKPYLNPNLSISELANMIGTNRTYLSEYLNNYLFVNFYDYINSYRTKRACILLKETNLHIEQIAEDSGFNSLSTFRRSFVKYQKCTPKQYRNKCSGLSNLT